VAADLDGRLVDPALAHRLPIVVSIDDARVARPQSGFNAASIVWQSPVDGYETRYLMAFQELDASDIGPVRSARFFFAHWAAELRAGFGHYGGDRRTRAWLKQHRGDWFTDLDGIGPGNPAYHRISSREAPHNAYSSSDALRARAVKLGASTTIDPAVHVRPFRDDAPPAYRGLAQSISIPYKTVTVGYTYDPRTNSYVRSLDGAAHVDPADGQVVTARTVVVLYMAFRTDSAIEPGHSRPVLTFIGSGRATIYAEGRAIEATWSKAGEDAPTLLLGDGGEELALIRGRIFMQVVPLTTEVVVSD
jgi:hypothetical protein